MQLNKFYTIKTARYTLPFYVREEVFCCTRQDYNDNFPALIFEPTPLEPFPLLYYVRKDINNVIVTAIPPMQILNRSSAHPMATLMGRTFHYGALDTVNRTRRIKTFIPLFKLHKIIRTKRLVGPAQMGRTDISTTQYDCEHGIAFTNGGLTPVDTDLPLEGEYAKMSFDSGIGSGDYIVEFLNEREIETELRRFERDMVSACTQHVEQQVMLQQEAQRQLRERQQTQEDQAVQQRAAELHAAQQYRDRNQRLEDALNALLEELQQIEANLQDK